MLTPLLIAKNGHIAASLREAMNAQNISISALAEKMGTTPSAVHNWVSGKNAPASKFRAVLSKTLNIPEKMLKSKIVAKQPPQAKPPTISPSQVKPPAPTPAASAEILTFSISPDGTCRLRIDAVLPADRGIQLFRALLNSGLIKQGDQANGSDTEQQDRDLANLLQ